MEIRKLWILTLAAACVVVMFNAFALTGAGAQETKIPKNVELVLDASGSMNGKLRGGTRKIAAAKQAVAQLVSKLPGEINLSFRAYGHQFHRSKHNCQDTALVVGFGKADIIAGQVVDASNSLTAQGYTPITHVLGLAADDLKPLDGSKTIILVSDGKETCEGDPCLLAKKLADANADLTIHTVGLGVDFQTKTQLQCIANVARGNYFDANSTDELATSMEEAATLEVPVPETETITIKIKKPEFGHLQVINGGYNPVYDAETGEKAGTATSSSKHKVKLKPGIYNVEFGKGLIWKSVQVVGGEITTISAGILKINNNQYHHIRDPETEHVYTSYSSSDKKLALPPGTYEVTFDKAIWQNVKIAEGETTLLDPAVLIIANNQYHGIHDRKSGQKLMTYSSSTKRLAVPPGTYDVSFDKAMWKGIVLNGGEEKVLRPAVLKIENNQYHGLHDGETGQKLMTYGSSTKRLAVPPGTYDLSFSKAFWKGIVLKEGEEKTLHPAVLKIANNQYHHVLDSETGKQVISYSSSTKFLAMPPGKFDVKFQKTLWNVTLNEGEETLLNPGGLKVTPKGYYNIRFADSGKPAGTLSSSDKRVMLASGNYIVKIGDQDVPFTVTEGKIIEIKIE